ncbi:MAG: hypothetical protein HKO63_03230 [Acidimicrobiia bacterium]|nr:hypothetical protein [Acidimicrobiia bacterium]
MAIGRISTSVALVVGLVVVLVAGTAQPAPSVEVDDPAIGAVSSGGLWTVPGAEPFFFGAPGDIPFLGDFNGDGMRTPGLYRPSTGFAYIRNTLDTGFADLEWFMGIPGDMPLVGDWDGDGVDSFGVFRDGTVFLRNQLSTGVADVAPYSFGIPGDVPFAGDFDGDGTDTVGVHRPTTGQVFMSNSQVTGVADLEFFFGNPGDLFVSGDWDGDSIDTVGVVRPSTDTFFYRNANDQGVADGQFEFDGDLVPVVPAPMAPAPLDASYTVTFTSTWSAATHPTSFPPGPHFSGLVGGSHNDQVTFWEAGQVASPGIESMAETGSQGLLLSEVQTAINAGDAGVAFSGGGISTSPGSVSLSLALSQDYSRATIVSMLAPSPDWFVGVSGLDLFDDGAWIEEATVTLWPYDAGTDSGSSYTSGNQDTNPALPITRIEAGPLGNGVPLGQFVFTLNPPA